MRTSVINAILQYQAGNITAKEGMSMVTSSFFPFNIDLEPEYNKLRAIPHIKKLICFLYNVEEDVLISTKTGRATSENIQPKVIYRAIIWEIHNKKNLVKACTVLGNIHHGSLLHSLKNHRAFMDTDEEYAETFKILKKIIL